jgi:hypothetical protein
VDGSDAWRVLRGGSRLNNRNYARVASRNYNHPDSRNNHSGFRVVVRRSPSHRLTPLRRQAISDLCSWRASGSESRLAPQARSRRKYRGENIAAKISRRKYRGENIAAKYRGEFLVWRN